MKYFISNRNIGFPFFGIRNIQSVTLKAEAQTSKSNTLFQAEVITTDNFMDFSDAVSKLLMDE